MQDSDDEEELTPQEVNPIVKKQSETSVQQQAEVLPKPEEVKENVKVDEEKASNEIVPVAQEKVEKGMVEATKKELAVIPPEKSGRDLLEVLKEVDDFFLRAADSGEKVSQMLETKKLHYHSSFSDSFRGELACLTLVLEVLLPHFAFFYCRITQCLSWRRIEKHLYHH